jgi:hypothetical protein
MDLPATRELLDTASENTGLATTGSDAGQQLDLSAPMDRRGFFRKLCLLSAAVVIPAGCNSGGDSASVTDTVDTIDSVDTISAPGQTELSRAAFASNIDTVFSVSHDLFGVVDLTLQNVNDEKAIPEADQFFISMVGPELPVLEEKTYQVYNDNIGEFELYIQPGTAADGTQSYFAVFSLLNA